MGIEQYKFVSPGVEVKEIDNTQRPKAPETIGPCVIGRTERGPGMRPVKINSFADFIEIFGNPIPGGKGGDVWRDGNYTAPTYASYAAQAWLANRTPLTVVRLLGTQHENATTDGYAGWMAGEIGTGSAAGGAYGLFINNASDLTSSLGAVFYFPNGGGISLVGYRVDTGALVSGTAFHLTSSNAEWTAAIHNSAGTEVFRSAFNFTENSDKYIRKVFNTNPILTNSDITATDNREVYWLGETFDQFINEVVAPSGSVGGVVLGLSSGSVEYSDYRMGSQKSKTGWFFGQDLSSDYDSYDAANMTKLFYFESLDSGEWESKNIKISIQDIKATTRDTNPYGTFTIIIRKANDHDGSLKVLERYTNCNLNPQDTENYVGRKIGDKYLEWNESQRRYLEKGNFDNVSKFVRIVMSSDVDNGAIDARLLPFGFYGPPQFKSFGVASGSTAATQTYAFAAGGSSLYNTLTSSFVGGIAVTRNFEFPYLKTRVSSSAGDLGSAKSAYFGVDFAKSDARRFDSSVKDVVRPLPSGLSETSANMQVSWYFSLDELVYTSTGPHAYYSSGSRVAGTSISAVSASYNTVLDLGFDKFTSPLYGGFDGLDITEREPFRNSKFASATELTSYEVNSLRRALDIVSDPEQVEMNILTLPGITNEGICSRGLDICEERGDCFFIMDITSDDSYKPSTEGTTETFDTINTVTSLRTEIQDRGLDSTYGAVYYPWLQIRDTITGGALWVPPSVPMLGVLASSEKNSELWFAPAGFNRGGLTNGAAGIPVTGIRYKLTKKERDQLYEVNINPIASFPSEGIVVFGQKTLYREESALTRINVRRLMIFLKKEISRIAAATIFDNNVVSTWNRFISKAQPILDAVIARYGLLEGKIILDSTTTTPDLVDRNIIYAKVYLRPARAAEFFALDFNITDSGAAFID